MVFFEVETYTCPTLHNQINLDNNICRSLLDYDNEYIKKLLVKEGMARNSLLAIEYSMD